MLQPSKARRASPRRAYAPTAAAASVSDTGASSHSRGRAEPTYEVSRAAVLMAGRSEHICWARLNEAGREAGRGWRRLDEAGRGWPRLAEAGGRPALRLIWRWRGVSRLEGESAEASGRGRFPHRRPISHNLTLSLTLTLTLFHIGGDPQDNP